MSAQTKTIKYKKTPGGVYYIADHNFTINSATEKIAVGKLLNGVAIPLTEEDVEVCKNIGSDYIIKRADSYVFSKSGEEFTVKSMDDLTVTGRWLDEEQCLLNEDDVELCVKLALKYDPESVQEEDGVSAGGVSEPEPVIAEAVVVIAEAVVVIAEAVVVIAEAVVVIAEPVVVIAEAEPAEPVIAEAEPVMVKAVVSNEAVKPVITSRLTQSLAQTLTKTISSLNELLTQFEEVDAMSNELETMRIEHARVLAEHDKLIETHRVVAEEYSKLKEKMTLLSSLLGGGK